MKPTNIHKKYYLYCLFTEQDGKVFYIGITSYPVKYRLKGHIRDSSIKKNDCYVHTNKISNKIRKLINSNIKFDILELISSECPNEISNLEVDYISWARSVGFNLCNLQLGGWKTYKHSDETKKKLSEKSKGKNNSGINNPMFGKKHSEQTKKIIGEKSVGRKWTEESKKKKSDKTKGVKRPFSEERLLLVRQNFSNGKNPASKKIHQINLETGQLINKFDCIKDAANFVKRSRHSISAAANGRSKSSGGFAWKYE